MPFYKHCSKFRDLVNYPSHVNGLAIWNNFGPLSCEHLGRDPIRSRSGLVPNLSGPKSVYVTTIKLCRFRTRSKTRKTRKPRRISFPRFFTPSFSFGTIPKTENSELKTSEFSPRHFDQTRRFSNSELFILHYTQTGNSEELKTSEFSSYAL